MSWSWRCQGRAKKWQGKWVLGTTIGPRATVLILVTVCIFKTLFCSVTVFTSVRWSKTVWAMDEKEHFPRHFFTNPRSIEAPGSVTPPHPHSPDPHHHHHHHQKIIGPWISAALLQPPHQGCHSIFWVRNLWPSTFSLERGWRWGWRWWWRWRWVCQRVSYCSLEGFQGHTVRHKSSLFPLLALVCSAQTMLQKTKPGLWHESQMIMWQGIFSLKAFLFFLSFFYYTVQTSMYGI